MRTLEKIISGILMGVTAFTLFGCKTPEYIEPVVETIVETPVEIEEVEPTYEEKISQYGLIELMNQIKDEDQELYEHYTKENVDKFLPVLADISKYISNEKILERRPTTDSLTELTEIIAPIENEQHKKNYVENSFKKQYAIIVTANAKHSIFNSLLPMWFCDQLNIDYVVINNTNSQGELLENHLEWWKKHSGMWDELELYYNQIQEAIVNGGNDKIKINFNADQILEEMAYQNETLDVDLLNTFFTADGIETEKVCKTMDGHYSGFNSESFGGVFKPNDRISEYNITDNSCWGDEFYNALNLSNNFRKIFAHGVKSDANLYSAIIIARELNDKRIEPYELEIVEKTKEQLEKEGITSLPTGDTIYNKEQNKHYSSWRVNGKKFYIVNGGVSDLEISTENIGEGESTHYKQIESLSDNKS